MKRLILVVSLLAPVQVFANHCPMDDDIAVRYVMWNQSEYTIGLKFFEPEHGENPHNFYLKPSRYPVEAFRDLY